MPDYITARFKSSEVALAAGMPVNTFRTYFKRGQFRMLGETDQPAESHGHAHLFSLRDALGFVVTAALIGAGIEARRAWEIGVFQFAHGADSTFRRGVGQLFDEATWGPTYLLCWPNQTRSKVVSVKDIRDNHSLTDALFASGESGADNEAVTILNLSALHSRAMQVLGEA